MTPQRQHAPIIGLEPTPWVGLDELGLAQSDTLAAAVGVQLAGAVGHIPFGDGGDPAMIWLGPLADPQAFRTAPAVPGGATQPSPPSSSSGGLPASKAPVGLPSSLQDLIGTLP